MSLFIVTECEDRMGLFNANDRRFLFDQKGRFSMSKKSEDIFCL